MREQLDFLLIECASLLRHAQIVFITANTLQQRTLSWFAGNNDSPAIAPLQDQLACIQPQATLALEAPVAGETMRPEQRLDLFLIIHRIFRGDERSADRDNEY